MGRPAVSGSRAIWAAAAEWRKGHPEFRLLAGTGTPSLTETIEFNRFVFDLGFEGVVVLPPFYYRNAGEQGLFRWYAQVIEDSVPDGGHLLGYHIPSTSGVALAPQLLARLAEGFPAHFAGLKDSSGDLTQAQAFIEALPGKAVLVGNDLLLRPGLEAGAAGCITAGANLWGDKLRAIYDGDLDTQRAVDPLRASLDSFPPAPAFLKAMLSHFRDLDLGPVRAPLQDLAADQASQSAEALRAAGYQ